EAEAGDRRSGGGGAGPRPSGDGPGSGSRRRGRGLRRRGGGSASRARPRSPGGRRGAPRPAPPRLAGAQGGSGLERADDRRQVRPVGGGRREDPVRNGR